MNRLMYFTGVTIILISSFILFNACSGEDDSCQYDDNGAGGFYNYLPPYIEDCIPVNLVNAPSNSASGQEFNYNVFKQAIFDSLPAYGGVQYAVMQNGILHLSDAQGSAREYQECPEMDLTACNKMNIASVSKILTAATTLKMLHDMGLHETATIGSYLPTSWGVSESMQNLTFEQMLSHRSGLHEFTANNSFDTTLSYAGLQTLAVNGPNPDSIGIRRYRNANVAMMRIIIPQLWKNLASCPTELLNTTIIDDATSQKYYDIAVHTFVLNQVGAQGDLDAAIYGDFETLYYQDNAKDGRSAGNWENKAGGGGWNMTAEDMVRVLDGIHNGTIVSTEIVDAMRTKVMGFWNYIPVNDGTLIGHGGDISYGDGELHNLLVHNRTNNVTIAVNINTPTNNDGGLYNIVQNAYNLAWQ